ncbi:MAG: LysR family transcriptional regulator [Afipia sp. 62-7]|nr:LysR family transcriptional regulator [Afipia sp.]OJU19917.1 MAG: LysR family transcriptional regulator [Afipia sp. 62-7]
MQQKSALRRGGDLPTKTDLNALILFYEVANMRSISATAAKLGLPKSTVSRKISVLEHQVGATLLRRGTRNSSLTEIGYVIYNHAQRIVAELEDAGFQATQMQSKLSGVLRISLPVDFGISWLSRLVADFSRHHPEMRLVLDINNRWVDVAEEPYDIAIHLTVPRNTSLPVRKFSSLSRGIYASPEYMAQVDKPRTMDDLFHLDVIMTTHQAEEGVWNLGRSDAQRANLEPRVLVNNIGMAREMVTAGMGVGILPNVMCRNDVTTGRLVRLFEEWESPRLQAHATYLGRRRVQRKTQVFMDFLSSYLLTDN